MSTSNLLVAGAINTDLVATMQRAPAAGETITADGFETFGGGKGANQAVSAARNGASVVLLGACGKDANGRDRIADLNNAGIGTSWVCIDDSHSSGVALIFVEPHGENRIAYVPGATRHVTVGHCVRCFAAIQPELILATNELPIDCLMQLFELASKSGIKTILNATPDPLDARPLIKHVDTLIVNEGEARELLDLDDSTEIEVDIIRNLLDQGPTTVVVTLGAQGAIAVTSTDSVNVLPPDVSVVDTTGAGDAFCGAYAAAIARGASIEVALRFGVFAGALATEVPGAQTSSPNRASIEHRMSKTAT